MTSHSIGLALALLWCLPTASCLGVGTDPGPVEEDIVSDVVDGGVDADIPPDGAVTPDTTDNSCPAEELLDFQCTEDLGAIEVCTEEQGWLQAATCGEGEACYDSPLELTASCQPLFDCYTTAVHYLSCDFGGLSLVDRVRCKGACIGHAGTQVHEPLINCYVDSACDQGSDPFGCVSTHCDQDLKDCLTITVETGPPLPSTPGCASLAACHSYCPGTCTDA
ncbi:MAG: hypothetical protein QF464_05775, partial [Myxococcota bacterium]|nr:hypothetical protein [Myxococcota bacterium]